MKQIMPVILFLFFTACSSSKDAVPAMGDIIFQTSQSSQAGAISEATGSKYTHIGIIVLQNNKPFVFHAGSKVEFTPFDTWVSSGKKGRYYVKRLKNSQELLTSQKQLEIVKLLTDYQGKQYDSLFQWSDDKMYCSELVWKIFKYGAGIELCQLRKFGDYKLNGKLMKELIQKRYNGNVNVNEKAVAPEDIFKSELLYDVEY